MSSFLPLEEQSGSVPSLPHAEVRVAVGGISGKDIPRS